MPAIWPRLLERLASGDPVVSIEEYRRWGKAEFERAISLGILREAEPAGWIMCDVCPDRHWSEVITVAGGRRMFISCPEDGSVNVEPWRLRQWRIDAGRVAELAAAALGLSGAVQVLLLQHLWGLGRRRLGGRYRDIFLGVGGGPPLVEMSAAIRSFIGQGAALLMSVGCDGSLDGLPAGHQAVDFTSVSRLESAQVVVDIEYLEDRFSEAAPASRKSPQSIAAPPGTAWGDVSIVVFEEFMRIAVGGQMHEVGFAEIGLDPQSQTVEFLKLFAAARGTVDGVKLRSVMSGDTPVRTRVLRLRQLLQELLDVDGNPIGYAQKAQTYTCNFQIRLDRDEGFRAPSGVSWLDLAFHERADSRILVSVTEKRQFRARVPHREDDRETEVAERDARITRIHSLEEIGLRSDAGRLSDEGAVFLELLRTGGIRARRDNELVVLRLAKRLRDWTEIEGDPLRLVEASNCWTAAFACSSDIRAAAR
jgi:hypothetical protein